jgi:hypothetical protein
MANHTYKRCLTPIMSERIDQAFGEIAAVWEEVIIGENAAIDIDIGLLNDAMQSVSMLQAVADELRWRGYLNAEDDLEGVPGRSRPICPRTDGPDRARARLD